MQPDPTSAIVSTAPRSDGAIVTAGLGDDGQGLRPLHRRLSRLFGRAGGTYALWVKDLASGASLGIRDGDVFPAASVIKLPVLLALLRMVETGAASLDERRTLTAQHKTGGAGIFQHFDDGLAVTLADACHAMIALSDNTATNLVLDVTGISRVNDLLDMLGCRRTRLHRYFGKPEMAGAPGPSPAVPAEIGLLLERLATGTILTPPLCRLALRILRHQTHRALAPRLLPEGTIVAHKTGSLDGVRHDVGLLWLPPSRTAGTAAPQAPSPVPALDRTDDDVPAHPAVAFVAMSRDVADRRWTVENQAEVTIARAIRHVYDAVLALRPPEAPPAGAAAGPSPAADTSRAAGYSPSVSSSTSSSSPPPVIDSRIEK